MALPKQKFRELVFQLLYSFDIGKPNDEDMVTFIMKEHEETKKTVYQAQEKVNAIIFKLEDIDRLISNVSISYEFSRIQSVERNILRLAIYELLFEKELPPKVAIAEALRMTRKFASPQSSCFINALLDSIYQVKLGNTLNQEELNRSIEDLMQSEKITQNMIQDIQTSKKNE